MMMPIPHPRCPALPEPEWIQSPKARDGDVAGPANVFRTQWRLADAPRGAWLQVTALGLVDCRLNGQAVWEDVFVPGWTHYPKRVRVWTVEVTDRLAAGLQTLDCTLADGWYAGKVANLPRGHYGKAPCLLARVVWETAAGEWRSEGTGPHWRVAGGAVLSADLMDGEEADGRIELPEGMGAGWRAVQGCRGVGPLLEANRDPGVRRMEWHPGRVLRCEAGGLLVDFGVNLAGWIRFTVSGPRGLRLRLQHGEMLTPEGELYRQNLRGAVAEDAYTLRGGGKESWEPRFTYHGFRYAAICWDAAAGGIEFSELTAVAVYQNLPVTGAFSSDHAGLNQLAENILRSQKGNFIEVPTDCPQRDERLGWTGDAQVFLPTAARWMDVRPFFRKWLRDLREGQHAGGAIPPTLPNTMAFGLPEDGGPAWADAALLVPWQLYEIYGDAEILRENHEMMLGYMGYLAAHKVKAGIRAHPEVDAWGGFGDWLALDGSGKLEGLTPKDLIGTAFYAKNAQILAETARVLGTGDAERWDRLRREVGEAFRERFLTADGRITPETQTGLVLALQFDLLLPGQRAGAVARLCELIRLNGTHLGTGFVGTPHVLPALEAGGELGLAYELLLQEEFPSWLFPVGQGATSIWERWDGWHPERGFQDSGMNSFNHYAYGAVGDWMFGTVAGLRFVPPGRDRILFAPRPGGGLRRAAARLDVAAGRIGIAWQRQGDLLLLELEVPPGHQAALDLPPGCGEAPAVLSPGQHRLRVRMSARTPERPS